MHAGSGPAPPGPGSESGSGPGPGAGVGPEPGRGAGPARADRADQAGSDEGAVWDLPPSAELRRLLEASLARLDFGDQEAVLLSVRHGLRAPEIGIVLGVSSRRAAARAARSVKLLDEACRTELALAAERCSADHGRPGHGRPDHGRPDHGRPDHGRPGHGSGVRDAQDASHDQAQDLGAPVAGASTVNAADGGPWHCADCERRSRVRASALLETALPAAIPAALRHRVLHTATDPELAGYRADIAARGGALTPDGLPAQPDMPSPFTKRWLLAGGGMVGALVTALIGAMLMGPGIGTGTIYWPPFGTRPAPSISDDVQRRPHDEGGSRETPPGRPTGAPPGGQAPVRPQGEETKRPEGSSPSPPSSPAPPSPGTLVVEPGKVELYGTKVGKIRLKASGGPVSWKATSSSSQLSVSTSEGELAGGRSVDVTVTLATHLINLPGRATVSFTDPQTGAGREISVVWGISLL
jgi:hypothetical protein